MLSSLSRSRIYKGSYDSSLMYWDPSQVASTLQNTPSKPYRLPYVYREAVNNELEEMIQVGVLKPSTSLWASPLLPVKKKDGSIWLCVDYRRLNDIPNKDAYPMPRINDLIDELGGASIITTLDIAEEYWQAPVRELDRPKTACSTPQGLFQFQMMPFGLQGAPTTFQRMMNSLLRGLK